MGALSVNSLKARIEREGFWSAARDAVGTLQPAKFQIWALAAEDAGAAAKSSAAKGIELASGPAAVEVLRRLRVSVTDLPVEFYRDEIDGIDGCFLACSGGRVAAVAWSYDHAKTAHFLLMSPGDAEIRSVYSLPEFRGRGLAKAVIAAACGSLARQDYRRIYAVIHFRNEASQRAFQSVGFSKVAELSRPPIFGPRYVTETGLTESWFGALGRTLRFRRFRAATPPDQQ
jgi:ribosomal protein S18 acetylase RimI-like enzyme